VKAVLYNDAGGVVFTSDPSSTLDAKIDLDLNAGRYYLHVMGTGTGNPKANPPTGYSDYASLGRYTVAGTIVEPTSLVPAADLPTPDEIGLHRGNTFYLDVDGNGTWMPGVDRVINWGLSGDTPLVGDWDGDGKDELGIHRGNTFYLDVDGTGGWTPGVDRAFQWGLAGDTPLVGDWDGDGKDELGIHRGNTFYLDVDDSGRWTPGVDRVIRWGLTGDTPLVGDWDGDAKDEVGIHRGNTFYLDVDDSGRWTPGVDRAFQWGLAGDTPLVGDWDGDAKDELGIHRGNTFYLDVDDSGRWTPGVDQAYRWGLTGDTPLVGNWTAASPLMAADGLARIESEAGTLTEAAVAPLLSQAVKAYSALPLSAQQRVLLGRVAVHVEDLAGSRLGQVLGIIIMLDENVAGYGWFIDLMPWDDAEFELPHSDSRLPHSDFRTPTSMDLLTVVMHELGHVLNYGHDQRGVMQETLPLGTRRASVSHLPNRDLSRLQGSQVARFGAELVALEWPANSAEVTALACGLAADRIHWQPAPHPGYVFGHEYGAGGVRRQTPRLNTPSAGDAVLERDAGLVEDRESAGFGRDLVDAFFARLGAEF
jgi:hypothetical protein